MRLRWVLTAALMVLRGMPALAQSAVPVSVAMATVQDVPVLAHGIGNVQALQTVVVRARVDGMLESVNFTEGQAVQKGQLLAVIDPRPYQALLDGAVAKRVADEASVVNARQNLERYQTLARTAAASQQTLQQAQMATGQGQATLQGDDAAIATAQLNLSFTHIVSPVAGRVGLRGLDPGNLVHASDTTGPGIVTVAETQPISVVFTLPQASLSAVQSAQRNGKVLVEAVSEDGKTVLGRGTLLAIDVMIDAATGTFRLKATFPNADEALWPGEFVSVRMLLGTLKGAVTVPSEAVQHGPDGLFVYVVKPDQTVLFQTVEVAQDDGHLAVVGKGLDGGTKVVTAGQSRLANGMRVTTSGKQAS